jgi:transmembrane sensor
MSALDRHALDARREAALGWCLRLAEGELGASERQAFEAWLAADPANPALFDEAVALWSGVEDQAGLPEMVVLRGQALESARHANMMRWARDRVMTRRAFAVAAMLLVAVFTSVWFVGLPHAYRTGVGERQVVALSDGSKLSLDADSLVTVRFTQARRELMLKRGRARFTVAKNPLRPFTVTAAGKTVVAVGTEISVERLGRQVRVILYEGKVSVLGQSSPLASPKPVPIGPTHKPADVVLKPGGELIMADAAPVAALEPADLARSLSWEGGQLVFKNEPLALAVEQVNRYAEQKVRIADASAGQVLISGVFAAGDTDAFVDGITAVFPVRAEQRDGKITMSSDPKRQEPVNDRASGASNPSSA